MRPRQMDEAVEYHKQMFGVVYDEMVDACVASRRVTTVFTNRHDIVVVKSERFGLKQDIRIDHANYLIFADESGVSTNQKKDGHIDGQKAICEWGLSCTCRRQNANMSHVSMSQHDVTFLC